MNKIRHKNVSIPDPKRRVLYESFENKNATAQLNQAEASVAIDDMIPPEALN
jgi:hypothetical protein